jgi:signal transduction histidine kinase/ligand-binding sensor domain-containing protein
MGSRFKLILLALSLFLAATSILASTGGLHFERIGTESGPPPEVITSLYQDRTGFVWIGSRDGLTLYDGHTFTIFEHDPADPYSITDNTIRTIYEDSRGNIWFGTNTGGLNRLDRATWRFEHFRHRSGDPKSISHDSINAILEGSDGALWVGTQVGLNRFDYETETFESFLAAPDQPGSITSDYIYTLFEDSHGHLWIGTIGGGLNLWDPESRTFSAFRHDPEKPSSLSNDLVFAMVEDRSGRLWIGTNVGLNLLDERTDSFRRFMHDPDDPDSMSDPLVTSLALGPAGTIWIGTHGGGLNELDTASGIFRAYRHDPARRNSLGNDQVIALLADRIGALWIGTWGGGLNRLTPSSLLLTASADLARMPEGVDIADVSALRIDSGGGVWIGTRSGDVVRRDPGKMEDRHYLYGGSAGTPRIIQQIVEDREGIIWVGTNNEIVRLDPAAGRTIDYRHDPDDAASIGPGYVKGMMVDRAGRLWIGTGEGGVQLLDSAGRVVERFLHDPDVPDSISDDYVTILYEDHEGTLWVGTRSGGLNALDPESGRATRYMPEPGGRDALSHHYVTSIIEDSQNVLWIGTGGGGLNRVDRSDDGELRFRRTTEAQGLIDDDVMGILEDDDGSFWISTKRGLTRFDHRNGVFANFFIADGLPSGEFEPAAVAASDKNLYFGSVRGLVAIPRGSAFPDPVASPTVITNIRTAAGALKSDRPVWELEELEVPWGDWLALEFAVMDFSAEHRHHYAYRLGDDTDEWIDLGTHREITFTNLDPGLYSFALRGRNSQGVWSMANPELTLRIIPPFWMTLWFRSLLVLAIVAAAILWHRVRTAALKKRNIELWNLTEQRERARQELRHAFERLRKLTRRLEEAKEEERKRIARELHDDMGPSLTAVIINLQLLSNGPDKQQTSQRIADTIDLVDRMVERIRDLSLDLRPPLIDELGLVAALSGYLEAQAERTGIDIQLKEGEVSRDLPPELEITAFRVVQEAVTNVIRHAGAKRAMVTIRQQHGRLDLIVSDEGRGFDVGDTMERATAGKALGLLGMQERVSMLGGQVAIESTPGEGTTIRASMPVEVET